MTSQQALVYAAQDRCSMGGWMTRAEAEMYIDRAINTDWWAERFPGVEAVELGRMDHRQQLAGVAVYDPECRCGLIEVRDRTSERTLIHELAHVCAIAELGKELGGGHGAHFVRTFLELTYRLRGEQHWLELRAAMLAEGVSIGD